MYSLDSMALIQGAYLLNSYNSSTRPDKKEFNYLFLY